MEDSIENEQKNIERQKKEIKDAQNNLNNSLNSNISNKTNNTFIKEEKTVIKSNRPFITKIEYKLRSKIPHLRQKIIEKKELYSISNINQNNTNYSSNKKSAPNRKYISKYKNIPHKKNYSFTKDKIINNKENKENFHSMKHIKSINEAFEIVKIEKIKTNKVNQIMKKIELFETNMEENKKSIKNITSDVFNLQRLKLEDLINEFYKFKNQNEKGIFEFESNSFISLLKVDCEYDKFIFIKKSYITLYAKRSKENIFLFFDCANALERFDEAEF